MENKFDFNYWAMLEPMKYYDKSDDQLSENLQKKRHDMIDNKNNEYVATEKHDGEWGAFIRGYGDEILIRSRSLSKVTGVYGDYTAKLPHLVEEMKQWPEGTVLLGEICWDEYGTVSTDVGTILRCLPAKAIERQKKKKLSVYLFDCLCFEGVSLINKGYNDRLKTLSSVSSNYFNITSVFDENYDFALAADTIIAKGGEGIVIQRKDYCYEPGKRAAWKTLKLKQKLPIMECQVVATIDANKEYNGKYPEDWSYFIDGVAVTKPYYLGWKMGVTFKYKNDVCDASSGLTDEDREWLATEEAQQLIDNGQLYVSIKSMMEASKGKLRHPVIKGLRIIDKNMLDGVNGN